MTANDSTLSFTDRRLGEIATSLPGATAVFRRHRLDFCCGGGLTLAEAAGARQLPVSQIEAELAALDPGMTTEVPTEPQALIAHILTRYHEVHRREIPELIRLAERVEARHRGHPQVPAGLAKLLAEVADELELHMQKEEQVLFPLMQRGGHPMLVHPITQMRTEHDEHGERLRRIETLSNDAVPPPDACPTWRALYAGLDKLGDDLMAHIHLENNVLFPAYMRQTSQPNGCGCAH